MRLFDLLLRGFGPVMGSIFSLSSTPFFCGVVGEARHDVGIIF